MLPDVLAPGDLAVISCSCSLFEKSHKSIVSLQIPPLFSPFREHPWGLLHALPPSPALPQRGGLVLPNPRASSPATAARCRGLLTQWRVSPRRCAHLCYSGGGDRLFAQHPWAEPHQPPGPYPRPSSVNPGQWPATHIRDTVSLP